ncbi:hypothetical protein [Burkholderia gladioli]
MSTGERHAASLLVRGVDTFITVYDHLVAKELRDRSDLLGALRVESHDFH